MKPKISPNNNPKAEQILTSKENCIPQYREKNNTKLNNAISEVINN